MKTTPAKASWRVRLGSNPKRTADARDAPLRGGLGNAGAARLVSRKRLTAALRKGRPGRASAGPRLRPGGAAAAARGARRGRGSARRRKPRFAPVPPGYSATELSGPRPGVGSRTEVPPASPLPAAAPVPGRTGPGPAARNKAVPRSSAEPLTASRRPARPRASAAAPPASRFRPRGYGASPGPWCPACSASALPFPPP